MNSEIVLIVGWNVTWFCTMSFRLIPLIMKLMASSRAPAVLKAKEPCPRSGAVKKAVRWRRNRPGNKQRQINKVAAVQGNFLHGSLVDRLPYGHGGGFNDRRCGLDRYYFGGARDLQTEVLHGVVADFQHNTIRYLRFKAVHLHLHAVRSRRQCGHFVESTCIGISGAFDREVCILDGYFGADNGSAALIGYSSLKSLRWFGQMSPLQILKEAAAAAMRKRLPFLTSHLPPKETAVICTVKEYLDFIYLMKIAVSPNAIAINIASQAYFVLCIPSSTLNRRQDIDIETTYIRKHLWEFQIVELP